MARGVVAPGRRYDAAMARIEADLHAHTTASDGTDSPEQLVARAVAAGLRALAVTDHDTVAAVPAALAAARGPHASHGLTVVPGIELSSRLRGGDVHLLGYFVPYDDPAFQVRLVELRAERLAAVAESVRRLRALGVSITLEDVQREAAGEALGRPHIARAMVRARVVEAEEDAFTPRYIGNGGAAHVPSHPVPPVAVVRLLREFGAAPVVAHPGAFRRGDTLHEADLAPLVAEGLVGLEVFHPVHDQGLRSHFGGVAARLGLVATGGSDWHGPRESRVGEGVELGREGVALATLEALTARLR
jgi:predicted metal-dependent phosphoesterase TrpH